MASEISKNNHEYHIGAEEYASRKPEAYFYPEENLPRVKAPVSAFKKKEKKMRSRRMRHFAVPALLLIAAACLFRPAPGAAAQHWEEEVYYTVVRGDTLWDISERYLGTVYGYHRIARENHIPNYDLIFPGQVIRITIRH